MYVKRKSSIVVTGPRYDYVQFIAKVPDKPMFVSIAKKHKAIDQLVAIVMLWFCAALLTALIFYIRGASPTDPYPVKEMTKFIGWNQLLIIFGSAMMLFLIFKAFGHRSKREDRHISDQYADLALDEIGSAFYHVGALLLVCAFVGAEFWYYLLSAPFLLLGYRLKPA